MNLFQIQKCLFNFGLIMILFSCNTIMPVKKNIVKISSGSIKAAVYINNKISGTTPLTISLFHHTRYKIQLKNKLYQNFTWTGKINQLKHFTLETTLLRRKEKRLHITSSPTGANVWIDGENMGKTPLELKDYDEDSYEIRLEKVNYKSYSGNIDLDEKKSQNTFHFELKDLQELFYLRAISQNPRNLHNYSDIAHHYMLQGNIKKAFQYIEKGLDIQSKNNIKFKRIYAEIGKISSFQYNYGRKNIPLARKELKKTFLHILKKSKKAPLLIYQTYIKFLILEKSYKEALSEAEVALYFYPRDKKIKTFYLKATNLLKGNQKKK